MSLWILLLAHLALAQGPSGPEAGGAFGPGPAIISSGQLTPVTGPTTSPTTATPVSTAVPSASVAPGTPVPGQGVYPPPQWWCTDNAPYCPGPLLQDVQLARVFPDSKTFVDKPTLHALNDTLAAWNAISGNVTVGAVETFVTDNFKGEGLELEQVAIQGFNPTPAILNNVSDPIYRAFVSTVHGYWALLIRQTNDSALCQAGACASSLIPLNHTIVVPGGRYRELYYWDSFWIITGLLESELYSYAWNLLQNFMDLIEAYGFLPNGGRKYYLNRSQPPVFTQMVDAYVKVTGNVTVLERALPLLERELEWFRVNRTIKVTSPWSNKTHQVAHYNVNNSAPRPEGYVEDWTTAFGASPALNETQRSALYAELATGAESGWDYSSRWCKQPLLNVSDNNQALRTLNIRAIVPVDLNALLAGNHQILANLYTIYGATLESKPGNASNQTLTKRQGNDTTTAPPPTGANSANPYSARIEHHLHMAESYKAAVLDLNWDATKAFFYDFNTTSNTRSPVYSMAGWWPLWQNITPAEVRAGNETAALGIVSGARYLLGQYAGVPSVATLLYTGLNWDFPNAWPPHLYTTIKAFETLGRVLPNASVLPNLTIPYSSVTAGQLGVTEAEIQPQPAAVVGNSSLSVPASHNASWPRALAIEYANRYLAAAFCSWYSTGGSLPGVLAQLPLADLNATGTYTAGTTGKMFEKFNTTDPDAAGGGGEYTVVTGFGWTNGVVLWAASAYGRYIGPPSCPLIPILSSANSTSTAGGPPSPAGNNTNSTATFPQHKFYGFRVPRALRS